MNVPILLQLKLQFQALHLNLPLPFMLQNLCIWLPMFRRGYVPCTGTVLWTLEATQRRQVPYHVSIGATETRHQY